MEFKVDNDLIRDAVEVVSNVIAPKNNMPILTSLMLKCDENKIVLIGSDGINAVKKVVSNIYIKENGIVCVSGALLKTILSKFKQGLTSFKMENDILHIANGKSHYKLSIMDSKDYPNIEFKKLENEIVFTNEDLVDSLSTTIVCCDITSKRPILTGVNFKMQGSVLTMTSTDSYRLARIIKNYDDVNAEFNITIPNDALKMLLKISEKQKKANISLLWGNGSNDVLFKVNDTLFKSRLLDGNYPDTSKLISSNYKQLIYFDKNKLLESLDRLCIFSESKEIARHIISFKENDSKEIIATSKNSIGNCIEDIEYNKDSVLYDEKLNITFSAEYLVEALKTFNDEEVSVYFNGNARPFIIANNSILDKVQLILPIKNEE